MDVTPASSRHVSPTLVAPAFALRRAQALVVALVMALAVASSPGLLVAGGGGVQPAYVLDASAVLPAGAQVVRSLPFLNAVIVTSPVAIPGAAALDTPARPEALTVETAEGVRIDSAVASTGAPQVWATGERGAQSVVALIDTGVAPVPALEGAVAGEIDFSGTGGGDGYGHGTFLASIVAGRGDVAPGVAPEAGVLSLKVADAAGSSTLGTILGALEWLHGPGSSAGIRVAALAMAVDPGTEAARLLDKAVDRVSQRGVLVITAAGNDGPGALTSPATARRSFSVGAVDDQGTPDRADDMVADFSSTGTDRARVAQPDALASGVSIVGSLPAGSVIAGLATPTADGLYVGSGTSMSTAVAAGVAALASSARPDLDGASLDAALRAGAGAIDASATLTAALAARGAPGNSGNAPGRSGNGPGNSGNAPGNSGNAPGNGVGADPQTIRWTTIRWTTIRWTGAGWGDAGWNMDAWGTIRWTGQGWASAVASPQTIRWTTIRWTAVDWSFRS